MLKKLLTVLFAFFCTGAAACEQQEFFPKATHESAVETITSVFPKLQRVSCIKLFTEMRRCSYEQGDIHFSIRFCENRINGVSNIEVKFPTLKDLPNAVAAAVVAAKISDPEEAEISKYLGAFLYNLPLPKQPKNVDVEFRVSTFSYTMSLDPKKSQQ